MVECPEERSETVSPGRLERLHARHNPVGPDAAVFFVARAWRARVETACGRQLLDFSCGGRLPLGHDNPQVRDWAVTAAATTDGPGLERPERVALRRKLAEVIPGGMNHRVRLCDSGPEALAAAVSLAGRVTGRNRVIYFETMTGEAESRFRDAAAVVVNPLHPGLESAADSCRACGALLVSDETRLAPGITGRLTALQGSDVRADLTVFGSGLACGLPLGAVVTGSSRLRWSDPDWGGTPAACRVALEFLAWLEAGLLDTAGELSARLREELVRTGEIRGRGLRLVLETQAPDSSRLAAACLRRGLIVKSAGERELAFEPPMVATGADVELAGSVLREALAEVCR